MDINQAKQLTVGQVVYCPADRGELPYSGRVVHIGTEVCTHMGGKPFVWITVRVNARQNAVWPSNRLG